MFGDEKHDYQEPGASYGVLSRRTRQHLINVYIRLGITVLFTALGGFLAAQGYIPEGRLAPILAGAGSLLVVQSTTLNATVRSVFLYGFGFLEGWGLAPLTNRMLEVEPGMLYQSALMSLLVFASFSATALYSQRRTFIYYGGVLMSAMLILAMAGLANLLYPTRFVFDILVYVGLLVFAFMVAFHTQVIVERSESERNLRLDSINDSVMLFNNLIAVFVRIAIIMMQQREREEERRRKGNKKQ